FELLSPLTPPVQVVRPGVGRKVFENVEPPADQRAIGVLALQPFFQNWTRQIRQVVHEYEEPEQSDACDQSRLDREMDHAGDAPDLASRRQPGKEPKDE